MTAVVAALASALALGGSDSGPPRPVLHSQGEQLVAAPGSSCWASPEEDGVTRCADTAPPVTKRSLAVRDRGRIRVEMGTKTRSLHAWLRGSEKRLRVRPVDDARRRFFVRLPADLKDRTVLNLLARYSRGDASFGARLRVR